MKLIISIIIGLLLIPMVTISTKNKEKEELLKEKDNFKELRRISDSLHSCQIIAINHQKLLIDINKKLLLNNKKEIIEVKYLLKKN